MALSKKDRRLRIKRRIRKVVVGTTLHPRLTVFRSNNEIYAQIINDETATTLVAASSVQKDIKSAKNPRNSIEFSPKLSGEVFGFNINKNRMAKIIPAKNSPMQISILTNTDFSL